MERMNKNRGFSHDGDKKLGFFLDDDLDFRLSGSIPKRESIGDNFSFPSNKSDKCLNFPDYIPLESDSASGSGVDPPLLAASPVDFRSSDACDPIDSCPDDFIPLSSGSDSNSYIPLCPEVETGNCIPLLSSDAVCSVAWPRICPLFLKDYLLSDEDKFSEDYDSDCGTAYFLKYETECDAHSSPRHDGFNRLASDRSELLDEAKISENSCPRTEIVAAEADIFADIFFYEKTWLQMRHCILPDISVRQSEVLAFELSIPRASSSLRRLRT